MLALEIFNLIFLITSATIFSIGCVFNRGRPKDLTIGKVAHVMSAAVLGGWIMFLGVLSSINLAMCLLQRIF